jgi:hypothetical protein
VIDSPDSAVLKVPYQQIIILVEGKGGSKVEARAQRWPPISAKAAASAACKPDDSASVGFQLEDSLVFFIRNE